MMRILNPGVSKEDIYLVLLWQGSDGPVPARGLAEALPGDAGRPRVLDRRDPLHLQRRLLRHHERRAQVDAAAGRHQVNRDYFVGQLIGKSIVCLLAWRYFSFES